MPNLLHGDFLIEYFFKTGGAQALAEAYFPLIKEEIAEKLAKIRTYQPYVHPHASFIAAKEVWKTFAPQVQKDVSQLQEKHRTVSVEAISCMTELFLASQSIPHEFIKKMLSFQIQQHGNFLKPDPSFEGRNFALFGFETPSDWFGDRFIQLMSQSVINIASFAKSKGYKVSLEEARLDLINTATTSLKSAFSSKISDQDILNYISQELYMLGIEEKRAYKAWQNVLLCKRLLDEVGDAVFIDPVLSHELSSFANQAVNVEQFSLPQELQLRNFSELMKLQAYLEAVYPKSVNSLDLPQTAASVVDVEKRCPELVEKKIYVSVKEVDLADLALHISLRETWDWERDEKNWSRLQKEFPQLATVVATTDDERYSALEHLDVNVRFEVDQLARTSIVKADPEAIKEALSAADEHKQWLSFRSNGKGTLTLKGISKAQELLSQLEGSETLAEYTQDGTHFYNFAVVEKQHQKRILAFAEAKNDALFAKVVDNKLERAYSEVREKSPSSFQKKDGSWKPFTEVKDQVGALLYASLLRSLEKEAVDKETKYDFQFYAAHRFVPYLKKARAALEKNPDDPQWLKEDVADLGWGLKKQTLCVAHNDTAALDNKEIFSLPVGSFSSVMVNPSGQSSFYHVISLQGASKATSKSVELPHAILAHEARREAVTGYIKMLKEKETLFAPQSSQDEAL
jgi:GcvH upstream region-like protein